MSGAKNHYRLLILGAGSGGVSIAARLVNTLPEASIAIIDPSETHYYQPLWTLVGAGIIKKEQTAKPMSELIPKGVQWLRDKIELVDPNAKTVTCSSGKKVGFDFLVVATGLKLDWAKIQGLEGNLGKNGLCSIYQFSEAERTAEMIQSFKGGNAIFTMPPVPIKCAGAPQKIMYLAEEIFRKNKVRDISKVIFAVAGKVIFGVPAFAAPLMKVASRKQIELNFSHKLIEVNAQERIATFEKTVDSNSSSAVQPTVERVSFPYDLLHVVPPMSAHDYLKQSGLAFAEGAQSGWLKVDPFTLQHQDYKNIFGIGDVTGVPNSKTGAAIRKQAPVVAQNILDAMAARELSMKYDGYSSCPLITENGKVILAEFGYDGKLLPSFPMDMTKERRSMWFLKKTLLPVMYWHGMMKGRM